MRLGGFEPPTNGLEGRRSSTELPARSPSVAPVRAELRLAAAADYARCGSLTREAAGRSPATGAEVDRDDRRGAAAVDARGARRVNGREADLAPARGQQVRAVRRAR